MKKVSRHFLSRYIVLVSILAGYVWPASTGATTVFYDGTFDPSTWGYTQFVFGNGGSQTTTQQMSGGNPNAYLYVENAVNPGQAGIWGVFLKNGAIYDPSLSGAIGSVNYAEDAILFSGTGEGQASFLVLEQGGNIYFHYPYFTTNFGNWTHLESSGLLASDFGLLDPTTLDIDNAQNPDFSGSGGAITFGFYRANSTQFSGYLTAGGIDNWHVTVEVAVQSVPEPASWILLFSGFAGIGVFSRKMFLRGRNESPKR